MYPVDPLHWAIGVKQSSLRSSSGQYIDAAVNKLLDRVEEAVETSESSDGGFVCTRVCANQLVHLKKSVQSTVKDKLIHTTLVGLTIIVVAALCQEGYLHVFV